jgi:Flp pilus assembly protein TadD
MWIYVALIALAAAAYANSVHGPFIFDDRGAVEHNATIRQLSSFGDVLSPPPGGLPVSGRPLVNLSFAVNYAVGGLDVRGYHFANIALHICSALLLFGIVRRTLTMGALGERWSESAAGLACVCALVWALHPIQTEAVDYLSKRSELLLGVFYLSALYASIRAATSGVAGWWLAMSDVACALGMTCKESMVTAPVAILLYDATFVSGSVGAALRRLRMFYAALAGTWVVLAASIWTGPRGVTAGFASGVTAWTYMLNQSRMIARYLWLTIWPRSLVLDYGEPVSLPLAAAAPYIALIVVLLALTVVALVRRPAWGFLGAWFFVTLAPTSSIVPIATEVGAESRMYLPLAAIVCAIVMAGSIASSRLRQSATPAIAVAILASIGLTAATWQRNAEYRSPVGLWRTTVDRWPNPQARRNFANALEDVGGRDEAVAQLREAIRDQPEARFALGKVLADQGRTSEALVELERAIAEMPSSPDVPAAGDLIANIEGRLANALFAKGEYREAGAHYTASLQARGDNAAAWQMLGLAQFRSGDTDQAVASLGRSVALAPNNESAQRNLAIVLLDRGDVKEAVTHAEQAVRLEPADALAQSVLAHARATAQQVTNRHGNPR